MVFPTIAGNIAPKAIEIENGVSGDAVKIGTNLYPQNQQGSDPLTSLPLFAADPLATFLGFGASALANTPLLNLDSGVSYVDWIKDTIVNNDPASVTDGVASGILTGVSGTTYNNQKRGHWQGGRVVDGIAGNDQDLFIKGGKEDDTSTWTIGPGSVGSSKYDITQAYIANTRYATADTTNFPTGFKNVLYFAMERRGNNGTTAFDFEFDQLPPLTQFIPNRTDGDVLFTFEMNGSGSSGSATPHIYIYHTSDHSFLNHELTGTSAIPVARRPVSNINQTTTPSAPWGYVNSNGNWTIGQIPNFSVAEAAVPFGIDFLTGVNGCGGHAYVQVRTRSSVTNTSDLKDTTSFFQYSFGGPHADLQLQSNCDQSLSYSAAGSHDSTGGGNLTYDWTFQAPAGVTLSSNDVEFGVDPSDSTKYHAEYTSDSVRNVAVNLPVGVNEADITASLKVTENGGCSDSTVNYTVHVFRVLGNTATLTAPCSSTHEVDYSSTVSGGNGTITYSWTFYKKGSPDVQVGTSSTASGSFNASSAGDYYGVLVVHDQADTSSDSHVVAKGSCMSQATSNTATAYDAVGGTATLTGVCNSRTLTFGSTATGGNGSYTYEWKLFKKVTGGSDQQVDSSTAASGTWTPADDGTYYATLKITEGSPNHCTFSTTSSNVEAYGPITVTPTLTGVCDARDLTYSAVVSGGKAPYTYAWKFWKKGGASDTQVGTSSATNGTFTPTEDGTYYATLDITDSHIVPPATTGCTGSGTSGNVTVAAAMNPSASKTGYSATSLNVTLTVTYHGPATVQWQKFVGGVWVDIANETGDSTTYSGFETDDPAPQTIDYTANNVSYHGKVYSVQIRAHTHRNLNGSCDEYSNPVTVTKTIGVDP